MKYKEEFRIILWSCCCHSFKIIFLMGKSLIGKAHSVFRKYVIAVSKI